SSAHTRSSGCIEDVSPPLSGGDPPGRAPLAVDWSAGGMEVTRCRTGRARPPATRPRSPTGAPGHRPVTVPGKVPRPARTPLSGTERARYTPLLSCLDDTNIN